GEDGVDFLEFFGRQVDLRGGEVFFQVAGAFGAGDGDDVIALRQYPGQGELAGRAALATRDLLDLRHQVEVLLEVSPLETRRVTPVVVRWEIINGSELTGKKTPPQRTVGDEADAEFADGGKEFPLRLATP